jgi:sodium transport system ATP-binding protein
MMEARGLSKSFGKVQAVREVSFLARDGRITGLLGPNGAGKSTTLRMLCTVLQPDAGEALIDGHVVAREPIAARRLIGVLSHASGLYSHLTGAESRRRADELVTLLELGDCAGRRAKGYSQGQRLKTALARALVHAPRNLVLDEPTNGLDVMAVRGLRALLDKLRDAGQCILFSSHVMQEVAMLCDDVVVIAHGTVVASGTPDGLRERAGEPGLEDAFVKLIGSGEGLG